MWFHHCNNSSCCPDTKTGTEIATKKRGRLAIDLHCHALIPEVERLVAGAHQKVEESSIAINTMGTESVAHNNASMWPIAIPRLTKMEQRIADMDEMGVDIQVISPSPTQYYYWADEDLAQETVRATNESIAELCASNPKRLAGLGTLALQHPELAIEQLEFAVRRLGLKGVEISSAVNGIELDDPSLRTFWAKAESLGAVVFIHPLGTTLGRRTSTHYLVNTLGQPLETTIALSRLIFSGVLDAYPQLKIVAAHGGGYLPTYIGRSDHAYSVRPDAAADTRRKPSDQLKSIWFDSVVYDPLSLRHLIDRVGSSQVVIGTDYPFDMGHYDVFDLIDAVPGLTNEEREKILGGNAAKLLSLSTSIKDSIEP